MPRGNQIKNAYTSPNKVELIRGGSQYFNLLLQLIEQSQKSVHLQTYIFEGDETGRQVIKALKIAAERNVQVYVLADGYASREMPALLIDEMKHSGINFRFFEPIFKSNNFYFGRRLHHKVLVVDEKYAMVGGVNISNRYNDMPGKPAWLDFALYTEGIIVKQLCGLCWKTWMGFKPEKGAMRCIEKPAQFNISAEENTMVRMRRNDWVRRKKQVSKTYIEMLHGAASHVTILCSYFLPGKIIRKNILLAVKRGVKIRVILAGFSDVPIAKNAERFMYDWLLRNKIEIYEYQKNVLHGKVAVADGEWMTIGSYNVNDISAYASIELNLDVKRASFAKQVEQTLEEIIKNDCIQVTNEQIHLTRNVFKQFTRWCSYEFFRLMVYLFTFYFKERN